MEGKVVKVEELVTFVAPGGAAKYVRTTYMVGEHGPFTVDLKEADFSPTAVQQKIAERAAALRALA